MYGGVYPEDKQWYRCRIKKLIEDDKVTLACSQSGFQYVLNWMSVLVGM